MPTSARCALWPAVGGFDAALANHLVMGPAILARAGVGPFAAKIHGSALEYTVKPNPRFLPYAYEGMEAASGVLVGSGHTGESLWAALPDRRTRGEDAPWPAGGRRRGVPPPAADREPLVAFVGKLIVSKGVDLLIAAWPLVRAAHPEAKLQIAGYGEYEDGLRRLLAALDRGDLDDAREVARLGWALEGGEQKPLPILSAFLVEPPPGYLQAAQGVASSVEFIGRLEHDQVAELLPRAEALVMPSTFPEAFGMVAVEAAACGAMPVSAGHSGMLEVSRQLAGGAATGGRSAHFVPGRGRRGRGDRGPSRRLAGATRGGAGERSEGPGGDRWTAVELGGSGPRGPRRRRGATLTVCRLHRMRPR